MKKIYLIIPPQILMFIMVLNGQIVQNFTYTGVTQTFVVPSCVSTITMEAWGAQGGANWISNTNYGGYAKGTFTVVPGSTLTVYVGQQPNGTAGGFNGGGNGEALGQGGGGASDVRIGGNAFANRIIVAGGGGGAGYWSSLHVVGGVGGGLVGGDGYRSTILDPGGQGGTQTGSGLGTCSTFNNPIVSGGFGFGGSPNGCGCEGYGGGGGWYGGAGSGNCRGGGGGSGYLLSSATATAFASGVNVGHGKVTFSYNTNGSGVIASASSYSFCSGYTATLAASNVLSYTWTPGGSNASSMTVSPTSNASYTVEGTNSLGCISSAVMNLTVDPGVPVLTVANTASATGGICPTKTVILTASGATTYTWTGGTGPVTNGVAFGPTTPATYIVTGQNACGTTTAATSVSVHPFPTVNPVASSSTLCAGGTLTLTATGNATNYVWSGGSAPPGNGVGFTPPVSMTTYSVIGTSVLGCTALATVPATVYATPLLAPTASSLLICIGGSATLSAQGAINYTWTSATQTVFTPTMVVTPAGIGVTTYTVIKNNSTCSDTKIISITTNSLPTVFALASPPLVCALQPAVISIAGGQTYTWTAPGTPTYNFNGASVIVYPQTSSLYTVAASDGTCITVTTLSLSVDPNPTISITATSPSVCMGQSVTLTANGGNSYTWTTPSGTSSGPSIQVSPTSATAYTLTGDNSFSCTASANQVILAFPSPVLNITVTKPVVCTGGLSTLTASGANNYTWGPTANNVLTPAAVVISTASVTGPVVYDVTGTFSATGCPGTQTTMVTVYIPTFAVTGNTNTCQGGIVTLSGSGANSYTWNTGSGTQLGQVLTATVTAPSVYTVSASATSSLVTCSSTQTIAVGINANPTVIAIPQRTTICKFEHVEIHAGGATSYTWQNPGSGSVNGATLTVSPQNLTNNYTVTGTDANGCMSTGTTQVKVSTCTGFGERNSAVNSLRIYPNPNNGEFVVSSSKDLALMLTNSLGQLIRIISLSSANNYYVSVTGLSKGIYLLSGEANGIKINQKIIVAE